MKPGEMGGGGGREERRGGEEGENGGGGEGGGGGGGRVRCGHILLFLFFFVKSGVVGCIQEFITIRVCNCHMVSTTTILAV